MAEKKEATKLITAKLSAEGAHIHYTGGKLKNGESGEVPESEAAVFIERGQAVEGAPSEEPEEGE